jgi:hypothetical protein
MGTNYRARLEGWGIDYDQRLAEIRAKLRADELLDLQRAWDSAREDVKAEFLVWAGVWEGQSATSERETVD